MTNKNIIDQIPEAVEYVSLQLSEKFEDTPAFRKELREKVFLQVQGEAVMILENTEIMNLLLAFDAIRTVCPEAVYVFPTQEKVLIFDHQMRDVLRSSDIFTKTKRIEWKEPKDKKVEEVIVDLDSIWESLSESKLFDRIELAAEKINKNLKKTDRIILLGSINPFIILLAQYESYKFAEKIYYQKTKDSQPVHIN